MSSSPTHPTLNIGKFSFEIWLEKNDLLEYKDLFIEYNMTSIDTITTSSTKYSELLSNPKIISNPLLISKIALTVNNLQTAYETVKNDVINKMETKLNELNEYDKLSDKSNDNLLLLFNHKLYEIEKTKDEKHLNDIRLKIQNLFLSLSKLLKKKEQTILKKFKLIQNEILSKYNKIIEKMKKNDDEIMIEKDYLNSHINYYKHNIQNKNKYDSIFEIRDIIYKIGKNIQKNDIKTRKLVTEKQSIINNINFYISNDIKKYIFNHIDKLIGFDIDTIKHTKKKKRLSLQQMRKVKSHNIPSTTTATKHMHPNKHFHSVNIHKNTKKNNNKKSRQRTCTRSSSSKSLHSLTKSKSASESYLNTNSNFDLINISPNIISKMTWIYNLEEDKCNTISIQLKKDICVRDINTSKYEILYQWHINEEDEKDNIVFEETNNYTNNIGEETSIDNSINNSLIIEPPNTPLPCGKMLRKYDTETTTNSQTITDTILSNISQWQKCKNVSYKQQIGKRTNILFCTIPIPNKYCGVNIDCIWVKLIESNHQKENTNVMTSHTQSPSTLSPVQRLLVEEGQCVKLQSSVEYNFDEIIIEKNAILTVNTNSKGYLLLKVKDKLEIHSHGKLNVSGLGHKGGKRYSTGDGKGAGGGCAKGYSSCGGGGGYGTFGENGRGWSDNIYRENVDGIGGNVYGDAALSTIHFGSGGGGGYGSRGGNGGGIICISCKNKIMFHENSGIYANGNKGKYYYDGCGSGGSIFIKCKYLYNYDQSICFIQAMGGKHNIEEQCGHGGNGGFGRIRIYSQNIKTIQQLKEQCFVVTPVPYIG